MQKFSERTLAPHGVCDNLVSTLSSSLANQHPSGDGLVKVLVQGIMEALRKFITMDDHEADKVGGMEKTQGSRPVVKPKFTADCEEKKKVC